MVMLVSIARASQHIRRDDDSDDDYLRILIEAASQGVLNLLTDTDTSDFLDSFGETEGDSEGEPEGVPELVQLATLVAVGEFYNNRENTDYGLPKTSRDLLVLYGRAPTVG